MVKIGAELPKLSQT